jgi:CRISPR system Cascade subunit CasB
VTAPTPAPIKQRRYVGDVVADVAGAYITELQRGYRADVSSTVARLAQLRRGAGKLPADVPELWGLTGTDRLYESEPRLVSDETSAERAEAALFLALTLYSAHQQSRGDRDMHKPGIPFGAAVRRLMGEEIDEPIRRRFTRIGTASTVPALAYRLREMITLLRGESIPLDYAQLAGQLYQAQVPGGLAKIRQKWGRDFHAYRPTAPKNDATTPSLAAGDAAATTDKDT